MPEKISKFSVRFLQQYKQKQTGTEENSSLFQNSEETNPSTEKI